MRKIQCHSSNYTKGRRKSIKYIVIHYTANDGDRAESNGNYFSRPNRNASAHYFVDENEVIISVDDSDTAWHCGARSYRHDECRNDNSIGVEMCTQKDSKGTFYVDDITRNNVLYLVKTLMAKYDVPVDNVIRHYDVTGKNCPAPYVQNSKAWSNFKKELTKNPIKPEVEEETKPEPVKPPTIEKDDLLINRMYSYRDTNKSCKVINHKGENYIRVRDFTKLIGESVSYDKYTKITRIGK